MTNFPLCENTAVITIGKNQVLIDKEDLSWLSNYSWYLGSTNKKYAMTNVYVNKWHSDVAMHRLLTGMSRYEVDHVNRNPLDNRKSNLRFAIECKT